MRSGNWRHLAERATKETNPTKMNELIYELNHVLGERERDERIAMTKTSSSTITQQICLRESNRKLEEEIARREHAEQAVKAGLVTSEAVLQELADQKFALDQHAIVAVTDVQGTITYVNEKFCAISQYSTDELIGRNHRILNSGHHPKEFFERMYHDIAKGMVWQGEIKNRAKDGSFYWVDTTIVPFMNADGKPHRYVAIRVDITERKRGEEAHEWLAALVRSSDDAIISKTLNGTITDWNSGAEKMFGYSPSEAVGKSMLILFPKERLDEEAGILARIRRGESVDHFETVRVRKDGSKIDVSVRISPIRDSSGVIVGASKIARDITERKRGEEALAEQTLELSRREKELARSNAELEQFAYVASHDLREPLRMIANYTQLLADRYRGKLDEQADKYIAYSADGATRMQALIQDLLKFSRVGTQEIELQTIDCRTLVEQALNNLQAAVQESGAVVNWNGLPSVMGNPSQLTQVFQNLIANAIKFHASETPLIHIDVEKKDHEWLFAVSDNGIGIPAENRKDIFVIFRRLHTRTEYAGNGIGLSICRKIIERHGGRIWVEDKAERGCLFKFTLPADPNAKTVKEALAPRMTDIVLVETTPLSTLAV
jgi:PAS domain S-box-containing protein